MRHCFKNRLIVACICVALGLSACEKKQQTVVKEDPPRAIKYMTLGSQMGQQQRILAGVVKAGTTSSVAFEVAGQVVKMDKKVGDEVKEGDLLAELDQTSYQLAIKSAEHQLAQAVSRQKELKSKYNQERLLFRKKYTSQSNLETAKANYESAAGSVGIAKTQLDIAKRDLAKTKLMAPLTGKIATKDVEVFANVNSGSAIYSIQTETKQVVEIAVPDSLINNIKLGDEVEISFPPLGGAAAKAKITEISPVSTSANAYPLQMELANSPQGLLPGMSAQVAFNFSNATDKALVVPLAAVGPLMQKADKGSVFVFDPDSSTVKKREVQILELKNNSLAIAGDIKAGDIIATAGVSFLHDGMKVKLLKTEKTF